MRLRVLTLSLLASAALALSASAAPAAATRGIGAGLMLGEPTGGTLKLWVDQDEAWVFGFGVSFLRDPSFQAQADYVLHIFEIGRELGVPQMPVYAGLGGRLNGPEDGKLEAGIRLPVGISYFFEKDQVEVFAELVPVLNLAPELRGDLNFGVGLRFYGW
jgi:hypothetical protein